MANKSEKRDSPDPIKAPGDAHLLPADPAFQRQMDVAEQVMHDDRDLLRDLSK